MKFTRVFSICAAMVAMLWAIPGLAADQTPHKMKFASQSVGSTGYNRNVALASVMNPNLPEGWSIEIAPISTGGVAGTLLVENGTAEIGEGINVPNRMLADGVYELKGKVLPKPKKAMSFMGSTDFAYFVVMMTEDFHKKTGVNSFEELVAKKIPFRLTTKAPGSASEVGSRLLLKALGLTYDDIKKMGGEVIQVAPSQMADLLKDGKADLTVDVVGLGQPALSELCMTTDMFIPQIAETTLQALEKEGYTPKVMPAGTWKGQDKDLNTMVQTSAHVVSKDVPVDVVYAMTKAVMENKPELVKLMPALEHFDPKEAAMPEMNGLPMHPGALKYYKEKGLVQ